ncbi:MAG: hypothetical protein HYX50_02705 [Chloroflexi bacterium]|nr:hypothetical protein [Chloroflexota bacterium]
MPSTTVDQGGAYYIEPFVVTLPPGRAFRLEASLNDPGGTLLYLLRDVTTGSTLKLDPQLKRIDGLVVTDPTVSGMFDEIVASLIVVSQ